MLNVHKRECGNSDGEVSHAFNVNKCVCKDSAKLLQIRECTQDAAPQPGGRHGVLRWQTPVTHLSRSKRLLPSVAAMAAPHHDHAQDQDHGGADAEPNDEPPPPREPLVVRCSICDTTLSLSSERPLEVSRTFYQG